MRDSRDRDSEKLDAKEISFKDVKGSGDKKPEGEVKIDFAPKSPFLAKLSNFWYYHKWKVIIISFFAIVFLVGFYQIMTKEDGDEAIVIAGASDFDNEKMMAVESVLTSLKPRNNDGSAKKLDLYTFTIYSEEEMHEANHSETNSDGNYVQNVSQAYNTEKIGEYDDFLSLGECSILIVSEYLYERQKTYNRVLPLSEIFGDKLPEGALEDGYGVRLGDTDLYAYSEALQALDEDMVVCILRSYWMGASSDKEKYAESKELYKRIVTFSYDGESESDSIPESEESSSGILEESETK